MHPDSVGFGRTPFPSQHRGPLEQRVEGLPLTEGKEVLSGLSGAS